MFHGSSGFAGEPDGGSTCVYQGLPRPPIRTSLQTVDPLMQWESLPFSFTLPSQEGVTLLDWWLMQPLVWGDIE